MTVYYSHGKNPTVAPICTVTSGGSISASFAGSYSAVYCFKGLGGFSDFSPASSFTLAAGEKVTITVPASVFKLTEVWHSVIVFIKRGTGDYYPVYEKFLFNPSNFLQWDAPSRLADVSITLEKDTHVNDNITITDHNAVDLNDYHNGKLVKITGSYYAIYKAPFLQFNTQTLTRTDNLGAFAYTPYGNLNPYSVGMRGDEPLSSIFAAPMYQRPVLYDPVYSGDGTAGFPQYFILTNETEQAIPSGNRILFGFFIDAEDYSSDFASLYYCKNLGFINLADFSYDPTDGVSSANMPDLGIERRCLNQASNFVLSRQLPPNYGILIQVYPKFHKYQLPVTIPTFYDLQIEPYFLLNLAQYSELGDILGDFILDQDNKRLIVPDLSHLIIKSGSGMVKSYYFRRASESVLPPLVYANNTCYVYIDINGTPIPYGTPPSAVEKESLALRAIVKNQSGFSNPIPLGTYTNWGDTFSFNFTAPTKIRESYPVIGDMGIRYAGKFAIIVKRGNAWKYQVFSGTYADQNTSLTFDFTSATSFNGLSNLAISNDSLFGFYDIQACVNNFSGSSGSNTYEIYVAEYYDGSQPSVIDHREISGCIPILRGTLQSLLSAVADIYPPVETINDLRALGSTTSPIPQYQQRLVLRPKPSYYVFYNDLTNPDDDYLYIKPNYIGGSAAGRWRRVAVESGRGYSHLYKVTNGAVSSGHIKLNQAENKLYVHRTTFEAVNANLWLSYIGKNTHIIVHNPYDFREICHFVISSSRLDNDVFEFVYIPSLSYLVNADALFENGKTVYISSDLRHYENAFSWHVVQLSNSLSNGTFRIRTTSNPNEVYIDISNISISGIDNSDYLSLAALKFSKVLFRNVKTNSISIYESRGNSLYKVIANPISSSTIGDIYEVYVPPQPVGYTEVLFLFKFRSTDSISSGQLYFNNNSIRFSKQAYVSIHIEQTVTIEDSCFSNGDIIELQSGAWYRRGIIYNINTSNSQYITADIVNISSSGAGLPPVDSNIVLRNLGSYTDKENYLGVVGTHFNNGVITGAIHGQYETLFTGNNNLAKFEHNGVTYIAQKNNQNITIYQSESPYDPVSNPQSSVIVFNPSNVRKVFKITFSSGTRASDAEVYIYQDATSIICKTSVSLLTNGIYKITTLEAVFRVIEITNAFTYRIEWIGSAPSLTGVIYEDIVLAGYAVASEGNSGNNNSGGSGGSSGSTPATSTEVLIDQLVYVYTDATSSISSSNFTVNVGFIEKGRDSYCFNYLYLGSAPSNKPSGFDVVSSFSDYPIMKIKIEYEDGYLIGIIDAPGNFNYTLPYSVSNGYADIITYTSVSGNTKTTNYDIADVTELKIFKLQNGTSISDDDNPDSYDDYNLPIPKFSNTFIKVASGFKVRASDSNSTWTNWQTEVLDPNDLSQLSDIAAIEVRNPYNQIQRVAGSGWFWYSKVFIYRRSNLRVRSKQFRVNDAFKAFSESASYAHVSQIKILESENWPPPNNTSCTLKFYKDKDGGFIRGLHCIKNGYGYITLDYGQVLKSNLEYLWNFKQMENGWNYQYSDYEDCPIWDVTLEFPVANIKIPCYLKPLEYRYLSNTIINISDLYPTSVSDVSDNTVAIYKPYMYSKDFLCVILPKDVTIRTPTDTGVSVDDPSIELVQFLKLQHSNSFYIHVNGMANRKSIFCREDFIGDYYWVKTWSIEYPYFRIEDNPCIITANMKTFRPWLDIYCMASPIESRFQDGTKLVYYYNARNSNLSEVDPGEIFIQYNSSTSVLTLYISLWPYNVTYSLPSSMFQIGTKIKLSYVEVNTGKYRYSNVYTLTAVTYQATRYILTTTGSFNTTAISYLSTARCYAYIIENLG